MTLALDHLVYVVPDLDAGIEAIDQLLGVPAVRGGSHPGLGTANAQIALGPSTYLEIIGPDPSIDPPDDLVFIGMEFSTPRLATWVAKASLADDASIPRVFGAVATGRRVKPDGTPISWLYSDPFEPRFDGVVPFLIDWQDTPHPASSLEQACSLVGLRLEHATPGLVTDSVGRFGGGIAVEAGDRPRLVATIDSPRGVVELS